MTLTIFDFFPRNVLKGIPKKYHIQSFRFLKNFLGSIPPKIAKKTENDTFGFYRFG